MATVISPKVAQDRDHARTDEIRNVSPVSESLSRALVNVFQEVESAELEERWTLATEGGA